MGLQVYTLIMLQRLSHFTEAALVLYVQRPQKLLYKKLKCIVYGCDTCCTVTPIEYMVNGLT